MANDINMDPIRRGDTKVFALRFLKQDKTPINLSGMDLWFTLKKKIADPDDEASLQKKVTLPDDETSQRGEGKIVLESNETDNLEPGTYFYDFQLVEVGIPPRVTTLAQGKIAVLADVTRRVS